MDDLTKKQARQWAINTAKTQMSMLEQSAAEFIIANTPHGLNNGDGVTIDGTEWVIGNVTNDGKLFLVSHTLTGYMNEYAENAVLTGKRYELREVAEPDHPADEDPADEPDHPEVLETLEDYVNAPEGTIVAWPNDYPWTKANGMWRSPFGWESSETLALHGESRRNVLRWGKDKEA